MEWFQGFWEHHLFQKPSLLLPDSWNSCIKTKAFISQLGRRVHTPCKVKLLTLGCRIVDLGRFLGRSFWWVRRETVVLSSWEAGQWRGPARRRNKGSKRLAQCQKQICFYLIVLLAFISFRTDSIPMKSWDWILIHSPQEFHQECVLGFESAQLCLGDDNSHPEGRCTPPIWPGREWIQGEGNLVTHRLYTPKWLHETMVMFISLILSW